MLLSVTIGFVIWWLSPEFTGTVEPWDSESAYMPLSLIIGGLVVGAIGGAPIWRWSVGIYVGEVLSMLARQITDPGIGANLMPLGVIFLIGYTLPSLLGSALGVWLNQRLQHH